MKVPADAKRVSLTGKTVMPMLIDTHVHLSGKRETLVRDLKQRAYWGVSTAMSMGTDNLELLPMRDEVIPGAARFMSAGRGITRPEPLRPTIFINSEEEGRKAIQENAKLKVDIVKIWVDDRNGKVQKITPAQYAAIIDEAHKLKIRITAHIFKMEDAKGLMRAGLDAFAHGVRDVDVDDEIVAMFKQRPNHRPQSEPAGPRREGGPELAAAGHDRRGVRQARGDQYRPAQDAGLPRHPGPQPGEDERRGRAHRHGNRRQPAWGPHEEMQDMVLAGMTPAQVIVASTRNGAEFLRIADAGTLEAGKSADLLVLDANPLDDITNTRRISMVILRGAAVDRSQAP